MTDYAVVLYGRNRNEPRLKIVSGFASEDEAVYWADRFARPQGGSPALRDSLQLIGGGPVLAVEVAPHDGGADFTAAFEQWQQEQAEAEREKEAAQRAKHEEALKAKRDAAVQAKAEELRIADENSKRAKFLAQAEKIIEEVKA